MVVAAQPAKNEAAVDAHDSDNSKQDGSRTPVHSLDSSRQTKHACEIVIESSVALMLNSTVWTCAEHVCNNEGGGGHPCCALVVRQLVWIARNIVHVRTIWHKSKVLEYNQSHEPQIWQFVPFVDM